MVDFASIGLARSIICRASAADSTPRICLREHVHQRTLCSITRRDAAHTASEYHRGAPRSKASPASTAPMAFLPQKAGLVEVAAHRDPSRCVGLNRKNNIFFACRTDRNSVPWPRQLAAQDASKSAASPAAAAMPVICASGRGSNGSNCCDNGGISL